LHQPSSGYNRDALRLLGANLGSRKRKYQRSVVVGFVKRTGSCDSRKFRKSRNCRFWFLRKTWESENQNARWIFLKKSKN